MELRQCPEKSFVPLGSYESKEWTIPLWIATPSRSATAEDVMTRLLQMVP
jgi:hypothetical protein